MKQLQNFKPDATASLSPILILIIVCLKKFMLIS